MNHQQVYLRAAEIVAQQPPGPADVLLPIIMAARPAKLAVSDECVDFADDLFGGVQRNQNICVLALCFLAAMCGGGDE